MKNKIIVDVCNKGFEKEYAEIIGDNKAIFVTPKFSKPLHLTKILDKWVYDESELIAGDTFVDDSLSEKLNRALKISREDVSAVDDFRFKFIYSTGAYLLLRKNFVEVYDGDSKGVFNIFLAEDSYQFANYFNLIAESDEDITEEDFNDAYVIKDTKGEIYDHSEGDGKELATLIVEGLNTVKKMGYSFLYSPEFNDDIDEYDDEEEFYFDEE